MFPLQTALQFKLCCLGPVNPQYLISWLCFLSKLLSIQAVLPRPVLLNTGLNFCCVEKNWPRQDSLAQEQLGKETQTRNEVLGIHWAQTAKFELKSNLERKHSEKNEVFSSLLLFYQHNDNTRYLWLNSAGAETSHVKRL